MTGHGNLQKEILPVTASRSQMLEIIQLAMKYAK
jgi:hypothetical protein